MSSTYSPEYFQAFGDLSVSSAAVIVPIVMRLVAPGTVVDVGCGLGQWLAAFKRGGAGEIKGLDGDYVQRDRLEIPIDAFQPHDLSQQFATDRRYDLAACMEVAEHLPETCAAGLVGSLTKAAPVVLFSAAIPHQPGRGHVNCQWPDYWAALFEREGYVLVDALRHQIWDDPRVAWWYQQNMVFYVNEEALPQYEQLGSLREAGFSRPLRLVHPEMFNVFLEWGLTESRRYWEMIAQPAEAPPTGSSRS